MAQTNSRSDKWHVVYNNLANIVDGFYKDHGVKSGKVLYRSMIHNEILLGANPWLGNISRYSKNKSIDPIHLFTSFNNYGLTDTSRIKIINELFSILGSQNTYRKIDFSGCPSPFGIKILSVREEKTQRQIWRLFHQIISEKQHGLKDFSFSNLYSWYGINIPSFSIWLFWIDARNFMPLDKNSEVLLYEMGILKGSIKDLDAYRALLPEVDSDLYISIASFAVGEKKGRLSLRELSGRFKKRNRIEGRKFEFKILAIEPVKGLAKKYLKNLSIGPVYQFYHGYNFKNPLKVSFTAKGKLDLYSTETTEINVSAIVGKNGSGKSTISELLFLAINNIAARVIKNTDVEFQPGVHLNVYFHLATLYKVELRGSLVFLVEYGFDGNNYEVKTKKKIGLTEVDLFYTISINYSHYSLNSKEIGPWIDKLFHKNDGYQTPLVLNPFRDAGNIDINSEAELVKQRMLSNLLEKIDRRDKFNLRKITDNGRVAETVIFNINRKKEDTLMSYKVNNEALIFSKLRQYFKFSSRISQKSLLPISKKYLVVKAHKIATQYSHYSKYLTKNGHLRSSKLNDYFKELEQDQSHITYKFRQAINFFKYDTGKYIKLGRKTSIEVLSQRLDITKSENISVGEVKTIELLPPAFLGFDIFLSDGSNFRDLSSGEKQKIYATSSVLYHLNNLDSISAGTHLVNYPFVNIIFDEIELYFHPDMQRSFINYLLNYIRNARFSQILSVNICFITHSPFILSDIPHSNILYLSEKGRPDLSLNREKTFSGNIHDLLGNNFYLHDGFMGQFAAEKTKSAVEHLTRKISGQQTAEGDHWDKDSLGEFIGLVGEPLLSDSLQELYGLAYKNDKKYLTDNDSL